MLIAMPSQDGKTISGHFGRSPFFVVYTVENGDVKNKEQRSNPVAHLHGDCSHGDGHHHSHAPMLSALSDVDVILSGGMGKKAYDDLVGAGKIVLMTGETDCEAAVKGFLSGNLAEAAQKSCGCDH